MKGVVFQDGTAVTPQDVAASLERTRARCAMGAAGRHVGRRRRRRGRAVAVHADERAAGAALATADVDHQGRQATRSAKIIGSGPFADRSDRPRAPPARAPRVRRLLRGAAVHRSPRAALVRHARRRGAAVRDRQCARFGARRRGVFGRPADVRGARRLGPRGGADVPRVRRDARGARARRRVSPRARSRDRPRWARRA